MGDEITSRLPGAPLDKMGATCTRVVRALGPRSCSVTHAGSTGTVGRRVLSRAPWFPLALALASGCSLPSREGPIAPAPAASAASAPTETNDDDPVPAEDGERSKPAFIDLAGHGQLPVVATVPPQGKRLPIVVGLHGSNMLPEWSCGSFAEVFASRAIVVCPAGDRHTVRPGPQRLRAYSWSSPHQMRERVGAAYAAVVSKWPDLAATEGTLLVTYSQSASLAAAMLADGLSPAFAAVVLWEGFSAPSAQQGKRITASGLQRALLVPGTEASRARAESDARAWRALGVSATVAYPGPVGRGWSDDVRASFVSHLGPLVAGLPAW